MRVLLVDDEPELVSTLAERLTLRGIAADYVTTAEAALAAIEDRCYDVAVLDVKLPGTSGLALKKTMQARSPELKFVFLTGHGSEEDYRAGLAETGERFYLVKPVRIDQLLHTIEDALGEKS